MFFRTQTLVLCYGGKDASSTIGYWTLTIRALLPLEQFFSSFFHTFFHATCVLFLCYFNAISMLLLHYSHTISMLFPCYPQDILQHYFYDISLMMLATTAIILKQTIHWRKMACTRGCYIYSHALKFFLTLTGTKSLFSEKTVSNESCL